MFYLCKKAASFTATSSEQRDRAFCLSRLYVYATYRCSLGCSHCWQTATRPSVDALLSLDVLRALLCCLESLSAEESLDGHAVTLLGGELLELAEADCLRFLKLLKGFGFKIRFQTSLFTNRERLLSYLPFLTDLQISFELGRPRLQQILENVAWLFQHRPTELPIRLTTTLTPAALQMPTDELLKLCYRTFNFDSVAFLPVFQSTAPQPYAEASRKLIEMAQQLTFDELILTVNHRQAYNLSKTAFCPYRLTMSLLPDGRLALGTFPTDRAVLQDYSTIPSEFAAQVIQHRRQLRDTLPSTCRTCAQQANCAFIEVPMPQSLLFDQQQSSLENTQHECLSLRAARQALQSTLPFCRCGS